MRSRDIRKGTVLLWLLVAMLSASLATPVWALSPQPLRGKIITNSKEINLPSSATNFAQKMMKQDRQVVKRDSNGKWVIHFVAFFTHPLPEDHAGVVLLNANGEPVAVASLQVERGQLNLASHLVVEGTDTPGKEHTLQVYYAKNKKPVVLAKKPIVLR